MSLIYHTYRKPWSCSRVRFPSLASLLSLWILSAVNIARTMVTASTAILVVMPGIYPGASCSARGQLRHRHKDSQSISPGHNTHLLAVGETRNNAAGGAEHDLQAARHRALPALSAVVGLPCQRTRNYAVDSRIPKECAHVSRRG